MNHNSPGSSIISILIYLAATTILVVLLLRASTTLYPRLLDCGRRTTSYVKLSAALDRIVHDLYAAPHDISEWNKIEEDEISWKHQKMTIGWRYKKNRLMRLEGSYDKKEKRWRTKAKSIAADSLSNCTFVMNKTEGQITGVTVVLTSTDNGQTLRRERTIALRTGALI